MRYVISDVVDNIFQFNPLCLQFLQFLSERTAHFHMPYYCIVVHSHIDGLQIYYWSNFEERTQLSYRCFYHYILYFHLFSSDYLFLNNKVRAIDLRLKYLHKACISNVYDFSLVEYNTLVDSEQADIDLESADLHFVLGKVAFIVNFHKLYLLIMN
jgi:hypothetical protein